MTLSNLFKLSALTIAISATLTGCTAESDSETAVDSNFNRIASFPVCSQLEVNCNVDTETAAEIVSVSEDGNTLVYTDSPADQLGFVDITTPETPSAAGILALGGEPTSVYVSGNYALVGVNTSEDYVNTSGYLAVVDMSLKTIINSIDLGGQPDSVAVSPDGSYAAIAIENERDEDLGEGIPPQAPAGFLVIVDMQGEPTEWTTRTVDFTSLEGMLFPTDPEPEYVDINENNIAVVTMQENNHIALVDLTDGSIVNHFSAGTVDLTDIDITEEKNLITLDGELNSVPREPDGVTWISTDHFVTADEGDMDGGSRGFTVFNTDGDVVYAPGNGLEHQVVRMGHYPDKRSENKGNEPENAEFANFDDQSYLFVASERSSVVFVYDVSDATAPALKQTLPTGAGPEGILAIPSKNLLIAASEEDSRDDKIRSTLNIYQYSETTANYPTVISADDENGQPIPWGAISGLVADPSMENTVYAVEDSFYLQSRIFELDTSEQPATLTEAYRIKDTNDVLASLTTVAVDNSLDEDDAARKDVFDSADLIALINEDKTVNLDPEGIAVASAGGFWVVSEGSGTITDTDDRPITSLNMVVKTDVDGVIEQVITLPTARNDEQVRFGFEGVAEYNDQLFVAQQRAWGSDSQPRIHIYDLTTETWTSVFYPLDEAESQNGGWVGLSDITSIGDGTFLVIERDNQGGQDAAIKRLYKVDLSATTDGETINKELVKDLMPELKATNGQVKEKIEGSALLSNGDVLIINDNDGVDDSNGETQLLNLGKLLD